MACTFPGCSNRLVETCLNCNMLRPHDPRKEQTLAGGSRQNRYWVTLGRAQLTANYMVTLGTSGAKTKGKIRVPQGQGSSPSHSCQHQPLAQGRGRIIHWMSSELSCTDHIFSGAFSLP